jgi:cholestenol delta-isomerase
VLGIVLLLVKLSGHLSLANRLIATWLAVTGAIHLVIEGYVVITPDYYQHPSDNYLSEAWKEYTKADSRYASRDPFVISMEAVTAFVVGPLCFVATYGILKRRAWCWALSLVVSVCQVYGDLLYYGTCLLEGFVHSRPEPLYFWGYFVLLNALWLVIPACVGVKSWNELVKNCGGANTKRRVD